MEAFRYICIQIRQIDENLTILQDAIGSFLLGRMDLSLRVTRVEVPDIFNIVLDCLFLDVSGWGFVFIALLTIFLDSFQVLLRG